MFLPRIDSHHLVENRSTCSSRCSNCIILHNLHTSLHHIEVTWLTTSFFFYYLLWIILCFIPTFDWYLIQAIESDWLDQAIILRYLEEVSSPKKQHYTQILFLSSHEY
jgi:hypothetical protein